MENCLLVLVLKRRVSWVIGTKGELLVLDEGGLKLVCLVGCSYCQNAGRSIKGAATSLISFYLLVSWLPWLPCIAQTHLVHTQSKTEWVKPKNSKKMLWVWKYPLQNSDVADEAMRATPLWMGTRILTKQVPGSFQVIWLFAFASWWILFLEDLTFHWTTKSAKTLIKELSSHQICKRMNL